MRATVALLALAVSAPARAEEPAKPRPAVLVAPFEGKGSTIGDLGYAATLKVLGALEAEDTTIIHNKQLNRVLEQHQRELAKLSYTDKLKQAARWLGATRIVTGSVALVKRPDASGKSRAMTSFTIEVLDGERVVASDTVEAPQLLPALNLVSEHITKLLVKLDGVEATRPITAMSTSSQTALLEYTACDRILIQQPIGIRDPVLLEQRLIDEAIGHCRASAKADPSFPEPRAALALAYALKGDQKAAEAELAGVKDEKSFLPLYTLAKFWVLNRYYDPALAIEFLRGVVRAHPGFTLARGYLGDALNVMGKHEDALRVFQDYLALVPNQPWVMGRIGYSYARAGDGHRAIEWTQKGLAIAPGEPELTLELASRLVDAGKLDEAKALLAGLTAGGGASGEAHLRLGYVHLLGGDLASAERDVVAGINAATKPSGWRTRGRGRYDLAKIKMKQGAPEDAIRQLKLAFDEGYVDAIAVDRDADLRPLAVDPRFKQFVGKNAATLPRYVSPFPVNPETGGLALDAQPKPVVAPGTF